MASLREIRMWAGTLRGMGREADCLVSAVKVSLAGTGSAHYAKFQIQNPPRDLPEGQYQVTFGGQIATVQKTNGFWLADARF